MDTCATCKFCLLLPNASYICRVRAPALNEKQPWQPGLFPRVEAKWWCGEFKAETQG